jgi:hypothetical protein
LGRDISEVINTSLIDTLACKRELAVVHRCCNSSVPSICVWLEGS